MQLGVLLAGEGVGVLAAIGVLRALERKGIGVHAVCGMGTGAYPAALWACGYGVQKMENCARTAAERGKRLLDTDWACALTGRGDALIQGRRIARLLLEQTKGIALRDCMRQTAFVCMAAPSRRTVVFSPQTQPPDGAVWTDHAPVWFAAQAAMSTPPLIRAANFIGIPLCAHPDAREGVRALYRLGATHVAAVCPIYVRGAPETLFDLAAWEASYRLEQALANVRRIRVSLPERVAPLGWTDIADCIRAGERAGAAVERADFTQEAGKVLVMKR